MADETRVKIVAEDAASGVLGKIEGHVGALTEKFGPLGGMVEGVIGKIGPAGLAFAGVAGAAIGAYEGIKAFAEKAIDAADKLSDLSKQTGVAASTISQYQAFLENSGSSAEGFASAVGKMNVKLGEARAGNADAIASFQQLGLSLDDIKTLSPEQAFLKIADAVKNTEDPTARAAALNEVLGKNYKELLPALAEGSEGFAAAAEQAQALGLAMSDEFVSRADQTKDALDNVGRITTGLSNKIAAELMPTIKASADGLLEWAANSGAIDVAAKVIVGAFNIIVNIGQVVGGAVSVLINQISGLFKAVVLFIQGEYKQAWDQTVSTYKSSGQIVVDTTEKMGKTWTGELGKFEPAAKSAAGAIGRIELASKAAKPEVDKAADAFKNFAKSIGEKLQIGEQEAIQGSKLTEGQKLAVKWVDALRDSTFKATDAEKAQVTAQIERIIQLEKEEAWSKTMEQANKDLEKSRLAEREALNKQISEVDGLIKKAVEENEKIGLTKAQQSELTAKRYDDIAAQYDAQVAAIATVESLQDQALELGKLSQKYKDLAQTVRDGSIKQANEDAAEASRKAWQQTSESIEKSLTDALLRGFESGKGFVTNLVATIKNLFNTMVLRPIIQAIVSPVAGAVTSLLGFGGNANAATNTLATAGGIGNLFGQGGVLSSAWNNLATSSIGTSLGLSMTTGATAANTAAAFGGTEAFIMGAEGAASAAGASLLAALPYVGAGLALATALGVFGGGETRSGSTLGYSRSGASYDSAGGVLGSIWSDDVRGAISAGQTMFLGGPSGGALGGTQTQAAVEATVSGLNELFEKLGSSARVDEFWGKLESSSAGKGGVFSGGRLTTGGAFGESTWEGATPRTIGAEDAIAAFGLDLTQSAIGALQAATDLPEAARSLLAGVDAESLTLSAANELLSRLVEIAQPASEMDQALDAALNDPGTQVAVSTEIAALIDVQREALGVEKEQRDILNAQVTQFGAYATKLQARVDELAASVAEMASAARLAATAPRAV